MAFEIEGDPTATRFYIENETDNFTIAWQDFEVLDEADQLIDGADITAAPNVNIDVGDEIAIYDSNNSDEKVFGGYVTEIDHSGEGEYSISAKEYAVVIVETKATQIYQNKSPEDILSDLFSSYTDLTFNAPQSSGVTLDKYVINGPIRKAVEDMVDALDWQLRTEPDKNVYFEPKGRIDSGLTFTDGQDARVENWNKNDSNFINKVVVKGGYANYNTDETFSGDGSTKEFSLAHKPIASVKVLVDGTEQEGGIAETLDSGDNYYVDQDNNLLIFDTAPASGTDNITIDYSYQVPITVSATENDAEIPYSEREISQTIERDFLKTFPDARQYAKEYLNNHSTPPRTATVIDEYDSDPKEGRLVTVVDSNKDIDDTYVVQKKRLRSDGFMELTVGSPQFNIIDWQHNVQDRINQLEKQATSDELVMRYEKYVEDLNVEFVEEVTVKIREVNDSFVVGNSVNGVVHAEPDTTIIDDFSSL